MGDFFGDMYTNGKALEDAKKEGAIEALGGIQAIVENMEIFESFEDGSCSKLDLEALKEEVNREIETLIETYELTDK